MRYSPKHQRRFVWQGVLILLPVVVLAALGFLSVRQDRRLAEHDAMQNAQTRADEIARIVWSRLNDPGSRQVFSNHTFQLAADGRLLWPVAAAPLPAPTPLEIQQLTEKEQSSWRLLQDASMKRSRPELIAGCRRLLAANPPGAFQAIVQFRLGQLLMAEGQLPEALAATRIVMEQFPAATTEGGLPLQPLAAFRLLEIQSASPRLLRQRPDQALDLFCSNLVQRPTFLTPHLLLQAAALQPAMGLSNTVGRWQQTWDRHQALRALAAAAQTEWTAGQESVVPATAQRTNSAGGVPVLSWMHAPDLNPDPQPLFPPDRQTVLALAEGRNSLPAVTVPGYVPPDAFSSPQSESVPQSEIWRQIPREWLVSRINAGQDGFWIVCRSLGFALPSARSGVNAKAPLTDLFQGLPHLPAWFGLSFEIAGVSLVPQDDALIVSSSPPGKTPELGGGETAPAPARGGKVLAFATQVEAGAELLRVNLHLAQPQLLFARQQARARWFGLLIIAAAGVAVFGFVSARRAFFNQQQLSELKSNFVSSVSHELRAPIASVRILAENLERGKVPSNEKQQEYFRFIVQECRRLSSLIENVLDFARIEQGRKQYEFIPTDLPALVRQSANLMQPAANERQVRLAITLDEAAFRALASPPLLDGAAIQQALVNLIDNAIKHSPAEATVTVGLEFSKPPAGPGSHQLRLWVLDHGPGIPAAEHDLIFERFYRRGSELRRETQGVGIGLSIVQHIAQAHHGRVLVASKPGEGSRFTLELPLNP